MAALLISLLATTLPVTVGVELTGLSEQSYARLDGLNLERTCMLRLVQEGFAVVSIAREPKVRIVVSDLGEAIGLRAIGPGGELTREVQGTGGSELHLELAQKMVELARLASREPPVVIVEAPALPAPAVPPPPEPIRVQPSAGVDAIIRLQGADVAVRVGLIVARARGLGLAVGAALSPSQGSGVRVFEWQVQGGAVYRFQASERIELSAALLAGVLLHDYALADFSALSPAGTLVDFLGSLPLSVTWHATAGLRLGARLAPGICARPVQHTRGAQVLWQRGAPRVEAGLVLGWEFP